MDWKEWRLMWARMDFLERTPRKTPAELQELEAWGRVVRRLEEAVEALPWMEAEAFWRVRLRQEPPEVVALDLGVSARWCRELARRGREKVEKALADRKGAGADAGESREPEALHERPGQGGCQEERQEGCCQNRPN